MNVFGSQPQFFRDRFTVHVLGSQTKLFLDSLCMFWAPKPKTFEVLKLKCKIDSLIKMCATCQVLFALQTMKLQYNSEQS